MKTISFESARQFFFSKRFRKRSNEAKNLGIQAIDLVICNLYPFEKVFRENRPKAELVENIDIGGPTMIRAGSKNFKDVCVLTSPDQYEFFIKEYDDLKLEYRELLSVQAFSLVSKYDHLISNSFNKEKINLRYGENPHQKAEFYPNGNSSINWTPKQGKQLSYNNLLDADSAYRSCMDLHFEMGQPAVSIIKHANPCGFACGNDELQTLREAWGGDPISAFGSIVCFSFNVEKEHAVFLTERFVEVVLAPSFSTESLEIFKQKKNCRIVEIKLEKDYQDQRMSRTIIGGVVTQDEDNISNWEFQSVPKLK